VEKKKNLFGDGQVLTKALWGKEGEGCETEKESVSLRGVTCQQQSFSLRREDFTWKRSYWQGLTRKGKGFEKEGKGGIVSAAFG